LFSNSSPEGSADLVVAFDTIARAPTGFSTGHLFNRKKAAVEQLDRDRLVSLFHHLLAFDAE
jgi:hypothetical protein